MADVVDVLHHVADALAELRAVDLDGVADETLSDAVLTMQRLRGGFEASEARLLTRFDSQGGWRTSGGKTAAAWLSWKERIPVETARVRLRHARAARDLPAVDAAWAAGEIDRAHITMLLGARNPRTREVFERDHEDLLDLAREQTFTSFKRACDHWSLAADPDGAEQDAEDDHAAREVHLNESIGGMWLGRITLDPVNGTIVDTTLRMIEQELFEQEWADAKARLGREPVVADLARTPAQRRADALVEMATRARTAPVGGRRPAPLFTVVCGLDQLTGPILELFNRRVITPGTAAARLTDAYVERIVVRQPIPRHRRRHQAPLLHRRPASGHRDPRPNLLPPLVRRGAAAPRGRPHPRSLQGWRDHPGERPLRLRLPQPRPLPPPRALPPDRRRPTITLVSGRRAGQTARREPHDRVPRR